MEVQFAFRQIIFAYVFGYLIYVLVSMALVPLHLLLKTIRPAGDWNERFEQLGDFLAAFAAGALCYFTSPNMGYLPDCSVAIALGLTFFISDARQLAYGARSLPNLIANAVGFTSSILVMLITYYRTHHA